MNLSNENQRVAGMFLLRTLLGTIFLMQGWGKVFNWGLDGVYQNAFVGHEATWIPVFILKATAYFTSFTELIGGLLLVFGLLRKWAFLLLGLVLLVVSFGHGLISPIWDLQHVLFRAVLLVPLLLLPIGWDRWALDGVFFKKEDA